MKYIHMCMSVSICRLLARPAVVSLIDLEVMKTQYRDLVSSVYENKVSVLVLCTWPSVTSASGLRMCMCVAQPQGIYTCRTHLDIHTHTCTHTCTCTCTCMYMHALINANDQLTDTYSLNDIRLWIHIAICMEREHIPLLCNNSASFPGNFFQ